MCKYIQLEFPNINSEQSEILIACLSIEGFDGFEEGEGFIKAFIIAENYNRSVAEELATKMNVTYIQSVIEETNWNAVWESNFQPVVVDDFVGIRADFHEPVAGVQHEIVITPKMSFGTGHHATTFMMIQQMREIDFKEKTVFDFGTGTGILSILAEKLGAASITAIDNDEWSISNTAENIKINDCLKIELVKADSITVNRHYDIILANINKNVILENFSSLVNIMEGSGTMILSGLLAEDEKDIVKVSTVYSLKTNKILLKNNWISLSLNY